MNLIQDIRSIEDVETAPRAVLSAVHRTRRPLIVTVDGQPDVIVLPAESLSSKMTAMKAAVELAGAEP
jgi:PHD/YefM family antitoxin component YafN of YafNO toxin-antitoxin module